MNVGNVSWTVRSGMILADSGAVGAAMALTRSYLNRSGLVEAAAARLNIVVEELVANLCDHAALPSQAMIGLRLERQPGGTALTLTDPGPSFDPRHTQPLGGLPPERGGGAGLALVQAWARIDDYTSADGRNKLRLWLPD